jgi:large subunit ribosomal protein L17
MIELVDFNEIYGKGTQAPAAEPAKKTRRAGGAKKKAAEATEAPAEDAAATGEDKAEA